MIPIPFTVLWLIALIVFAVGEAITVGLTSVWFAVGALGALIAAGFGAALWLQVVVFLALSGVTLLLVRPLAKKFLTPRLPGHQCGPGHRCHSTGHRGDRQPEGERPGEYLGTGLDRSLRP